MKFYKIKDGATAHLNSLGYWLDNYPDDIDGLICSKVNDYTHLQYPHFEVCLINLNVPNVGISPDYLEPI